MIVLLSCFDSISWTIILGEKLKSWKVHHIENVNLILMSKTHWKDRVQVDFKIRLENRDLFQECFLYKFQSSCWSLFARWYNSERPLVCLPKLFIRGVFQNCIEVLFETCKKFIKDANNIATKFSTESQSDNEVNYNSGADADIFSITKVSPVKRSKTR